MNIITVSIDLKKKESKDQELLGQLRYFSFYQACLAEFIGTFILVFFAIGFGLNSDPCDATGILNGGLVTGLLVIKLFFLFLEDLICFLKILS